MVINKDALFGCQIWLEPDDSTDRINELFAAARISGLSWVRVFLMWPWIERRPGQWDWRMWDDAFNAAAANGIRIKATLTANSGPSHLGTPNILHSHTGFLDASQREPVMHDLTIHALD